MFLLYFRTGQYDWIWSQRPRVYFRWILDHFGAIWHIKDGGFATTRDGPQERICRNGREVTDTEDCESNFIHRCRALDAGAHA